MAGEVLWIFVSLGVLGGGVRALYGLLKALNTGETFSKGYFLITLITGGVIGGILGSMFEADYRVAALAGYVGTDILENFVKLAVPHKLIIKRS